MSTADLRQTMIAVMADPEIAEAFADPRMYPISKKLMKDPTILLDPLNRLKDDLADPALATIASSLFPKLSAYLPPSSRLLNPSAPEVTEALERKRTNEQAQKRADEQRQQSTSSPLALMMKNQATLPRLPLPSLDSTRALLLEVLEPIVERGTFEKSVVAVDDFFTKHAPRLQEKLAAIDKSCPDESWFHGFHNDMYMNARYPTYLYKNPAGIVKAELLSKLGLSGQVDVAANVVCATLVFASKVMNETLAPDDFRGIPIDMLQYPRMFCTNRIPAVGRDYMYKNPEPKAVTHIVVIRGGRFWKLELGPDISSVSVLGVKVALQKIIDSDGKAPSTNEATAGASAVATTVAAASCVGALTTANRDVWARNREHLSSLGTNGALLRCIDDALFVLCLDEEVKGEDNSALEFVMRSAVHGDVVSRYFDKPVQVIVTASGMMCNNCEHSWGDGIPLLRWGMELFTELQNPSYQKTEVVAYEPTLFEWTVDSIIEAAVESARTTALELAESSTACEFYFRSFGADFFKQHKISPDAAVQQALQLAYVKKHGKMVSEYCVAQHMAFKAGRNERMRGSTLSTKAFIDSVVAGDPVAEQYDKLVKASERHATLSRMCTMGFGFDRHIYALNRIAQTDFESGGAAVPALFKDEGFVALMTDTLCSSSLDAPFIELMMVKPAFSDFTDGDASANAEAAAEHRKGQYHCLYSTRGDHIRFCLNGFVPGNMKTMRDSLVESLEQVKSIITQGSSAVPAPAPAPSEAPVADAPDMRKVLAAAMADPEIAQAMADPKLAPITKRIMRDPSILLDPMNRLKDELAADRELAKLAAQLFPKLMNLLPKPMRVEAKASSAADPLREALDKAASLSRSLDTRQYDEALERKRTNEQAQKRADEQRKINATDSDAAFAVPASELLLKIQSLEARKSQLEASVQGFEDAAYARTDEIRRLKEREARNPQHSPGESGSWSEEKRELIAELGYLKKVMNSASQKAEETAAIARHELEVARSRIEVLERVNERDETRMLAQSEQLQQQLNKLASDYSLLEELHSGTEDRAREADLQLKLRDARISVLEMKVDEFQAKSRGYDSKSLALEQREREIERLEAELKKRDTTLSSKIEECKSKQFLVDRKDAEIVKLKQQITHMSQGGAPLPAEDQTVTVLNLKSEIHQLKEKNSKLGQDLKSAKQAVTAVRNALGIDDAAPATIELPASTNKGGGIMSPTVLSRSPRPFSDPTQPSPATSSADGVTFPPVVRTRPASAGGNLSPRPFQSTPSANSVAAGDSTVSALKQPVSAVKRNSVGGEKRKVSFSVDTNPVPVIMNLAAPPTPFPNHGRDRDSAAAAAAVAASKLPLSLASQFENLVDGDTNRLFVNLDDLKAPERYSAGSAAGSAVKSPIAFFNPGWQLRNDAGSNSSSASGSPREESFDVLAGSVQRQKYQEAGTGKQPSPPKWTVSGDPQSDHKRRVRSLLFGARSITASPKKGGD